MTAEVLPLLRIFRQVDLPIPTLYIMGEEDYMFLPGVQKGGGPSPVGKTTSFAEVWTCS